MLITFIVAVTILAALYLLINICNVKMYRPNFDFSTGPTKSWLIFAHTLFCVSFLAMASGIIFYYFLEDKEPLWGLFSISLLFAILDLLLLCVMYFTFEAIIDDEVYIRRFFTVKKINVNTIRSINNINPRRICFFGRNNTCLFLVDLSTPGINELIHLINVRKSEVTDNKTQEAVLAEEKTILAKLGQEYRASYNERKKKV